MDDLLLVLLVIAALAASVYAQYRLPVHTRGRKALRTARLLLLITGLAFGYVMATVYVEVTGIRQLGVFLGGFGLVHVPAAFILLIKRRRGVYR